MFAAEAVTNENASNTAARITAETTQLSPSAPHSHSIVLSHGNALI